MCITKKRTPDLHSRIYGFMVIVKLLQERDQSIYRLCRELGTTSRTIHRYIRTMREIGIEIERTKKGVYLIKSCPFCGK